MEDAYRMERLRYEREIQELKEKTCVTIVHEQKPSIYVI